MSNIPKGPKRLVRKRPTGSTFKPRPSREIDDRPYFKPQRDDRDDRPRQSYRDDRPPRGGGGRDDRRPGPRREFDGPPRGRDRDGGRPGPRRDYDGPPRGRDHDRGRPGPRRDFDGPPRGRDRDGGRPGPRRDFGGPPRGRGEFGDKKWGDKPSYPRKDDRGPSDNRVLMDTIKRIDSGMMEILDRLAKLEKEIASLKE